MRIVGFIESYTESTLVGWAYSPDRPGERLVLMVECEGTALAAGLANLDRQDVAAAGHGDGLCGFRIRVHLPPGKQLTVREVSSGTIFFSDVPEQASEGRSDPENAGPRSDIVQGNVDNVLGAVIRGWCWQPGRPDSHVTVQAVIDGQVVAVGVADQSRGDLINAGVGKGDHAFNLRMPFWSLDGQERKVWVHAEGHGPLHDAPVPFMCLGGGPLTLLEQLSSGNARERDRTAAAGLLRCYLEQVQHYMPASVGFGEYLGWRAALTGTQADDVPLPMAESREGLAAVVQHLRLGSGMRMIAILDEGAVLYPGALTRAATVMERSGANILYGDADLPVDGGLLPWFRPDWNYDLCLSQDYTRGLTLFRAELLEAIGPSASATSLRLRALLRQGPEGRIHHLPEVLCQLRRSPGPMLAEHAAMAVREHLATRGASGGRVTTIDPQEGLRRVEWPAPAEPPLISLIIPTRDRLSLVRAAVDSIEARTRNATYEIIIIDNQSREPETLNWLADGERRGRFRVQHYDAPFNFADMNNQAARHARGRIIGFINNDVELIDGNWLVEVNALLARPEVGAVGARLRFSNGMIQHGGVVVGTGGLAENAFQTVHVDDTGYFHRTRVAGNYSAVTAACLFCRRSDFEVLGGFDAENLPVAFNDVDFCLRLRETGALIVWTPAIDLYHHESLSRGRDSTPERLVRAMKEETYMRRRWGRRTMADPYYNPNLNLDGVPFTGLALPPRHRWGLDL